MVELVFAKIDLAGTCLKLEVRIFSLSAPTRVYFSLTTFHLFQQTMDALLTGLTGVTAYIDGIIIITGTTQEELLQCLCARMNPPIWILPKSLQICILPNTDKISWIHF